MDSLSDALKQFAPADFQEKSEKLTKKVLEDSAVREWLHDHPELQPDVVHTHINQFYQYLRERQNCNACPGLDRCPNDFQGHYTELHTEENLESGLIHDRKVSCGLFRAQQIQSRIQKRINSFYVDNIALSKGYTSQEILETDPKRMDAVRQLMKYVLKTKESGLQPMGLFLTGPFGTGKTFLACYLLRELAKTGLSGTIVYVPDFVEDLKSMFQLPQKLKETIELLKQTDLLVFDDIGAENLNPWLRDHVLAAILNYRMNRKPTFYTSNYSLDALRNISVLRIKTATTNSKESGLWSGFVLSWNQSK